MVEAKADHLAVVLLLSADPGRTAAFFRDLIGLDLQAEEHDGRHTHYACTTGSVYFTIQYSGDFPGPPPATGRDSLQLCFTVPDLTAFVEKLRQSGIEPLHPPVALRAYDFHHPARSRRPYPARHDAVEVEFAKSVRNELWGKFPTCLN